MTARRAQLLRCGTIMLLIAAVSAKAASASQPRSSSQASPAASKRPPGAGAVALLNDTNFDIWTAQGAWLVNIFAPWCSHCRHLAPLWDELPRYLDSFQDEVPDARVGKIDGTQNPVLVSRFKPEGYPAIYFLKNGQTWVYNGQRSLKAFKEFMATGHLSEQALPLHKAPNSWLGRVLGGIYKVPRDLQDAYVTVKTRHGWSDLGMLAAILAVPVLTGALTICAVDVFVHRLAKDADDDAAHAEPVAPEAARGVQPQEAQAADDGMEDDDAREEYDAEGVDEQ